MLTFHSAGKEYEMQNWLSNPTFVVYAITCLVLCANLMFLWGFSGGVRGKTQTALNSEDLSTVSKGASMAATDPPEVARVLRAHRNAEANIYPFLFLGLIYVMIGGDAGWAKIFFGVFTGCRLLHSVVYLAGKQPWRTLSFVLGGLTTVALLGDIVWIMVKQ